VQIIPINFKFIGIFMGRNIHIAKNLIILIFIMAVSYLVFSQVMKLFVPVLVKEDVSGRSDILRNVSQDAAYSKENDFAKETESRSNSVSDENQTEKQENKQPDSLENKDDNHEEVQIKQPEITTSFTEELPNLNEKNNEPDNAAETNDDNYVIPYDKLISMKNIGLMDKLSVMAIVSKIKKSNMNKIYAIAKDGVTLEEINEIKVILEEDLNKKDMNKLMKIINKNMDLYAQGKLD